MSKREVEAQVRAIIMNDRSDVQFTSDEVRARERELSELVEMRMEHSGNLFFVRKGAPKNLELISPLDRVVVDDLYDWKRPRKRQRYLQLRADPKYAGPIMVAEGDSWFEHPLIPDLIEWAGEGYAVLSLARAGDTWSDMLNQDSDPAKKYSDGTLMGLVHTVNEEDTEPRPPGTVLLSAGGNDLIGQISKCVYDYDPKRPEDKYINHTEFDPILGLVLQDYRTKTTELGAKGKTVILHSYDYPNPMDNGQYIGLPLQRDRNIPSVGLMRQVVNQMVDFLAVGLIDIAAKSSGHAHFVNLRGTIGTMDYLNGPDQRLWSDEMHGSRPGFERLWDVLHAGIKKYAH